MICCLMSGNGPGEESIHNPLKSHYQEENQIQNPCYAWLK